MEEGRWRGGGSKVRGGKGVAEKGDRKRMGEGEERRGEERNGMEWNGMERKGKERKGKERNEKKRKWERRGKIPKEVGAGCDQPQDDFVNVEIFAKDGANIAF